MLVITCLVKYGVWSMIVMTGLMLMVVVIKKLINIDSSDLRICRGWKITCGW